MEMNTTEYLLKIREYQLTLDALLHSAVSRAFNSGTLNVISNNVISGINALRTIQLKLSQALSVDYTYTAYTYPPYMERVEIPQLFHQEAIKEYYIERLQVIADDIVSNWEALTYFIGDQTGLTNQQVAKGDVWINRQTLLVTALDNLITALETDIIDNS